MQCTLPKGLRVTDGKLTEIWRSRAEQCAHVQQSMTGESVVKLSNILQWLQSQSLVLHGGQRMMHPHTTALQITLSQSHTCAHGSDLSTLESSLTTSQ